MAELSRELVQFLEDQGCVIVSTIDDKGFAHSACKGIVKIDQEGNVYLFDLYQGRTYDNLEKNPRISITAFDEHRFIGYCLKGKAGIVKKDVLEPEIIKAWEDRITSRLTRRVLKNLREEKGHPAHPEVLLPKPAYLILMKVSEIVDLAPHNLR